MRREGLFSPYTPGYWACQQTLLVQQRDWSHWQREVFSLTQTGQTAWREIVVFDRWLAIDPSRTLPLFVILGYPSSLVSNSDLQRISPGEFA
jgi:hypothetical protein